jgi:hypothetical protein
VVLWVEPFWHPTTLRSATGELTIDGFRLAVTASDQRAPGWAAGAHADGERVGGVAE